MKRKPKKMIIKELREIHVFTIRRKGSSKINKCLSNVSIIQAL